ncbi:MAG: bifunctional metallophosphatase/5'-nucleotidase [Betaproteobacteria bacterium]|nr:bifunctional metallophosphatase/5'-nucleotidase [Betaproteobacteria bacterium]
MRLPITLLTCVAALLAGCALPPAAVPPAPAATVKVQILAINDFHGNLKPPLDGIRVRDPANPDKRINIDAGGAEYLATQVALLRARNANHVFVAAGDLIGASPLLSALFHDEPTVEALSLMGLEASAVGNHEFDKGATELLRMQRGGCNPADGCKGPKPFKGAGYQYLAASTVVEATGQTLFPAYHVKTFEGIPVAFIGLTLKGTPNIVVPAGVAGLRFDDEAQTVNRLVPGLRAQGIEAIVVLIHEGGVPVGDYNECPGISGPIVDIVKKLDKAVDLVISGHTHRAYNCRIDGRLVTSGDKYGTIVTAIDLVLDRQTRDVVSAQAENHIVRNATLAKAPEQTALIAQYERLAGPLTQRVVGRIAAALPRDSNPAGETALGQVVADAQLAATRDAGAQIALMNPGGIRASLALPADGLVRYEDLFSVQPFYNNLVTMTLSGAQILQLLEQQWVGQVSARLMQVSRGFGYTWDAARPLGQRVVPGSVTLDRKALDPAARYRVTVNAFMADGGDSFTALKVGTDRRTGMMDVDALERYVQANPTLAPGKLDRIARLN